MMRIRATCEDPSLVDEAAIREVKPLGVVRSGPFVQIIVRFNATAMVEEMNEIVAAAEAENQEMRGGSDNLSTLAALAHTENCNCG